MNSHTYPSDLSDQQMRLLESLITEPDTGRPMKQRMAHILNAVFYVVRTGCPRRYRASDFPPWQTVYYHFNKWKKMVH
ncbi:transposase, partial [Desulfococcaceae bacterium HSG7]|nr:transposase [Desulfococcaceae bacterium HSG7]